MPLHKPSSTPWESEKRRTNVVVIGAGVVGLTTALVLSRSPSLRVTIVAEHFPGDSHPMYASPWAGANYLPFSQRGTLEHSLERDTWLPLALLASELPEAGVHFQDVILYTRQQDVARGLDSSLLSNLHSPDPWFKDMVPDFRLLDPTSDDPPDTAYTTRFKSVCINPAIYLPWLHGQCLKRGVRAKRATLAHIHDAAAMFSNTDTVVNCTGLGACSLGGVKDETMVPIRGQTALVAQEASHMLTVSGSEDGNDSELTYAMKRAGGGGTVVGGCYAPTAFEDIKKAAAPDDHLARRFLHRWVKYDKVMEGVGLADVIEHRVGFRPSRKGGIRLEPAIIDGLKVVHCYGHGGYGYQTSWGCAERVRQIVVDEVKGTKHSHRLSRL